jgi:hypothetical protein
MGYSIVVQPAGIVGKMFDFLETGNLISGLVQLPASSFHFRESCNLHFMETLFRRFEQ